jgi:hypothetical protein
VNDGECTVTYAGIAPVPTPLDPADIARLEDEVGIAAPVTLASADGVRSRPADVTSNVPAIPSND